MSYLHPDQQLRLRALELAVDTIKGRPGPASIDFVVDAAEAYDKFLRNN